MISKLTRRIKIDVSASQSDSVYTQMLLLASPMIVWKGSPPDVRDPAPQAQYLYLTPEPDGRYYTLSIGIDRKNFLSDQATLFDPKKGRLSDAFC